MLLENLSQKKTADAMINGEKWEIKTLFTPTKRAVNDALDRAKGQAKNLVLHVRCGISEDDLRRGVKGRIRLTKLKRILIIMPDETLRDMGRREILAW